MYLGKYKIKTQNSRTIVLESQNRLKTLQEVQDYLGQEVTQSKQSSIGEILHEGKRILVKGAQGAQGLSLEKEAQKSLNEQIKKHKSVDIIMPHRTLKNITSCGVLQGNRKQDFGLFQGSELKGFISYKAGTSQKCFNGYGGITPKIIQMHPEVQDFVKTIKEITQGELNIGESYMRVVQEPFLQNLSVYGKDFGKDYGEDNVDVILQGNIELKETQNGFILDSNMTHWNQELLEGEYTPVLGQRYTSDRNNQGIKNTRITVNQLQGRNWKYKV